jgi:hypothetical protein
MTSYAGSSRKLTRVRCGLILAFALALGLGLASSRQSALAGAQGTGEVNDRASSGTAIILADNIHVKNNKNWNKNANKNWNKNHYNWNNNWNKNWNNRAYVRGWSRRPHYGDFIGGIVLGTIIASTGVGIVPYAPQPNLCWYWADPYMNRGYWDYCY